jgi:nitrogen fixation-related uncharacterized protein
MARKKSSESRSRARFDLLKDLIFILIGAAIAIALAKSGWLDTVLGFLGSVPVASFVAGIFFTSAFTIAPSSVALSHLAESSPLPTVALWGALGALCGDLILFFFIRDRFADDLRHSLKPSLLKHIMSSFHLGFMKWLAPILGAFIIASPLPDEIGLTLMGLSRVRLVVLIPVSFVMNVVGIYALVWFAHSV